MDRKTDPPSFYWLGYCHKLCFYLSVVLRIKYTYLWQKLCYLIAFLKGKFSLMRIIPIREHLETALLNLAKTVTRRSCELNSVNCAKKNSSIPFT